MRVGDRDVAAARRSPAACPGPGGSARRSNRDPPRSGWRQTTRGGPSAAGAQPVERVAGDDVCAASGRWRCPRRPARRARSARGAPPRARDGDDRALVAGDPVAPVEAGGDGERPLAGRAARRRGRLAPVWRSASPLDGDADQRAAVRRDEQRAVRADDEVRAAGEVGAVGAGRGGQRRASRSSPASSGRSAAASGRAGRCRSRAAGRAASNASDGAGAELQALGARRAVAERARVRRGAAVAGRQAAAAAPVPPPAPDWPAAAGPCSGCAATGAPLKLGSGPSSGPGIGIAGCWAVAGAAPARQRAPRRQDRTLCA